MSLLGLAKRLRTELEGARTARTEYEQIYLALTFDAGTAEDLAAIGRHIALNGFWVADEIAWLDRRCDRLARARADEATYRAAVLLLVARIDELRRRHAGILLPPSSRQLAVEKNAPVRRTATLPDGTEVADVGRFLGRLLTAIDYLLAHSKVTATEAVLDVYLTQLATLGVVGHLETVQ